MTTGPRLLATLVFACLATTPTFAQLPVAPELRPTLDELVKEYQRCGLPVPPKDAELVRFKDSLGFRDPAAKPGEPSRCLVGISWEELLPEEELP
jgi:hypothetical protein